MIRKSKIKQILFFDIFCASEPIINNKTNNFIYRINKNHKTRNKNISQINFFKNTIINLNSKSINIFIITTYLIYIIETTVQKIF